MKYFILALTLVSSLLSFSCCDRHARSSTLGDAVISLINGNYDMPVAGCALAKQCYHIMDAEDRRRVKAVIELQTKNERDDVRKASIQTLAELRGLDVAL